MIQCLDIDIQAIVFDLDGTAIPKNPKGMPSKRVIDAVQKAKEKCHVSIATGRPLELCMPILDALQIDDLCILNGGSHLYSRKTNEYVWKQEIPSGELQEIFSKLRNFNYQVVDEKWLERVSIKEYSPKDPIALSCIFAVSKVDAQAITNILKQLNRITSHTMSSWTNNLYDIHITHELATKKHALQSLASHLNVELDKVMVVGDGGNDIPLFDLAGLKVAMGNSDIELINYADWVTPSVDEDGLAVAIEKYIYSKC